MPLKDWYVNKPGKGVEVEKGGHALGVNIAIATNFDRIPKTVWTSPMVVSEFRIF